MAKQNLFLAKLQLEAEWKRAKGAFIARQQTLDKVTIALGMMGFTAEQFEEFGKLYSEVENDYALEVIEDGEADKTLAYSTNKIDRVIKQYVPDYLFTSYEERYDYSDLAKAYGVKLDNA